MFKIHHGALVRLIGVLSEAPYKEAYELIPYLSNLEPVEGEETQQPKIITE